MMYRIAWRHTSGASGVNDIDHNKADIDSMLPILHALTGEFTYWAVPVVNEYAAADAETSAYLVAHGGDGEIPDADPHGDLSKFKDAEVSY